MKGPMPKYKINDLIWVRRQERYEQIRVKHIALDRRTHTPVYICQSPYDSMALIDVPEDMICRPPDLTCVPEADTRLWIYIRLAVKAVLARQKKHIDNAGYRLYMHYPPRIHSLIRRMNNKRRMKRLKRAYDKLREE